MHIEQCTFVQTHSITSENKTLVLIIFAFLLQMMIKFQINLNVLNKKYIV